MWAFNLGEKAKVTRCEVLHPWMWPVCKVFSYWFCMLKNTNGQKKKKSWLKFNSRSESTLCPIFPLSLHLAAHFPSQYLISHSCHRVISSHLFPLLYICHPLTLFPSFHCFPPSIRGRLTRASFNGLNSSINYCLNFNSTFLCNVSHFHMLYDWFVPPFPLLFPSSYGHNCHIGRQWIDNLRSTPAFSTVFSWLDSRYCLLSQQIQFFSFYFSFLLFRSNLQHSYTETWVVINAANNLMNVKHPLQDANRMDLLHFVFPDKGNLPYCFNVCTITSLHLFMSVVRLNLIN